MTGKTDLSAYIPEFSRTLGDELLRPTRIYAPALDCLRRRGVHIRAASHIVGGLYESIPRMLPVGLTARIETSTFPASPIFDMIADKGHISDEEMYRIFNMGIGMAIVVAQQDVGLVKDILCCGGERNYIIGSLVKGNKGVELL
ncbi:Phosphoribosylformylglycinamidine cyclo-ligase [bioreactor metagenome]|uniref:phosphoribosylformylglycinamidine cyclo-ligase n=1 Tax=bioreactor metagenome TaxID=1076179 RepID=A0A644WBX5_9ZZZZ